MDIQTAEEPEVSDMESFETTLKEKNVTLKTLTISHKTKWCNEESKWVPLYQHKQAQEAAKSLDFYLSLNRNGRHKLLHDNAHTATSEDWLDAIADNKNLSEIFYWCQRNPFVCLPKSLGGIIPAPTPQSIAKEKARQAAKYANLYSWFSGLNLRGPKNVQAALEDPNPRPVSKVTFHFSHGGPGLQAHDLAAIIRRQSSAFTSLMFYFVSIQGDFKQVLEALRERESFQYFFAQGMSGIDANSLVQTLGEMPGFNSLTLTWSDATLANLTNLLRKRKMTSLLCSGTPPATEKEVANYFEAAEQSPQLEKLECIMRDAPMTTTHIGYMGKFLRNHRKISYIEIRAAQEASLLPVADALQHNKSLSRLTITVDGMSARNPVFKKAEIVAFRDVLATKNSTLKSLKVCKESWHGDHLWKPQYARDDETRQILQEIEQYLAQNAKGRSLPSSTTVVTSVPKVRGRSRSRPGSCSTRSCSSRSSSRGRSRSRPRSYSTSSYSSHSFRSSTRSRSRSCSHSSRSHSVSTRSRSRSRSPSERTQPLTQAEAKCAALEAQVEALTAARAKDEMEKNMLQNRIAVLENLSKEQDQRLERLEQQQRQHQPKKKATKPKWRLFRPCKRL